MAAARTVNLGLLSVVVWRRDCHQGLRPFSQPKAAKINTDGRQRMGVTCDVQLCIFGTHGSNGKLKVTLSDCDPNEHSI